MAIKKTTRKVSKKVKLDIDLNKNDNKKVKKAGKKIKKLSMGVLFFAVLLLAVGTIGGYIGVQYLCKNDCFTIVGEDEIECSLNETYYDQGVKVVAFGKDDADKVVVETNLKQNIDGGFYAEVEGTYYIKYTVDNIKYGSIFKIQKIRLIHFVEPTEESEVVGNE